MIIMISHDKFLIQLVLFLLGRRRLFICGYSAVVTEL